MTAPRPADSPDLAGSRERQHQRVRPPRQGGRARPSNARPCTRLGDLTVEQLLVDLLTPMLRDWLDQNLPAIVERVVEQEVKKLARRAELTLSGPAASLTRPCRRGADPAPPSSEARAMPALKQRGRSAACSPAQVVGVTGATLTGACLSPGAGRPSIGDLVAMPTGARPRLRRRPRPAQGPARRGSAGRRDPAPGRGSSDARTACRSSAAASRPTRRSTRRSWPGPPVPRSPWSTPSPAVPHVEIGQLRHDADLPAYLADRQPARQALRRPRQHRLGQVLRGHRHPARAARAPSPTPTSC